MFPEKSDEVADGGDDGFTLFVSVDFGDLDGVVNEAFKVVDCIAEINCVVHVSNDWFVGRDYFSKRLGEMIWLRATEDLNNLFSVSDR